MVVISFWTVTTWYWVRGERIKFSAVSRATMECCKFGGCSISLSIISWKKSTSNSTSDTTVRTCTWILGLQRTWVIAILIEGLWSSNAVPFSYNPYSCLNKFFCSWIKDLLRKMLFCGIKKLGQTPSYTHLRRSLKHIQKPSKIFCGHHWRSVLCWMAHKTDVLMW